MVLNPHHQYTGSQNGPSNMNYANGGMGQTMLASSQYEYSIESQPEQARQGSKTG
jgi:hypothetical protein